MGLAAGVGEDEEKETCPRSHCLLKLARVHSLLWYLSRAVQTQGWCLLGEGGKGILRGLCSLWSQGALDGSGLAKQNRS